MEEHKGKRRNIHIIMNGTDLFYTAKVTKVTKTHISFIDKYNKEYTYRKERVEEICPVPSKRKGG